MKFDIGECVVYLGGVYQIDLREFSERKGVLYGLRHISTGKVSYPIREKCLRRLHEHIFKVDDKVSIDKVIFPSVRILKDVPGVIREVLPENRYRVKLKNHAGTVEEHGLNMKLIPKKQTIDGEETVTGEKIVLWDIPTERNGIYRVVREEEISPQNPPPKEGDRIKVRLGKTIFDAVIVEVEKSAYDLRPERTRYKVQLTLNKQLIWVDPSTVVQDSDKPDERQPKSRPDWIPADVILGMGDVLAWGKGKYPGNDWKTMSPDLHLAAAQRHLLKHAKGELNDDESGMNHLYHAMVRLAFYTCLVDSSRKAQNK